MIVLRLFQIYVLTKMHDQIGRAGRLWQESCSRKTADGTGTAAGWTATGGTATDGMERASCHDGRPTKGHARTSSSAMPGRAMALAEILHDGYGRNGRSASSRSGSGRVTYLCVRTVTEKKTASERMQHERSTTGASAQRAATSGVAAIGMAAARATAMRADQS